LLIAPKILGKGIPAVGDLRIRRLAGAVTFRECGFHTLSPDLLFWGYPEK
jgi:hypothetical protein